MRPGQRVRAICSDGNVRSALIIRDADTYFSLPARVNVRGRTVTGYVWYDMDGALKFSRDIWRKNADALPDWPS